MSRSCNLKHLSFFFSFLLSNEWNIFILTYSIALFSVSHAVPMEDLLLLWLVHTTIRLCLFLFFLSSKRGQIIHAPNRYWILPHHRSSHGHSSYGYLLSSLPPSFSLLSLQQFQFPFFHHFLNRIFLTSTTILLTLFCRVLHFFSSHQFEISSCDTGTELPSW